MTKQELEILKAKVNDFESLEGDISMIGDFIHRLERLSRIKDVFNNIHFDIENTDGNGCMSSSPYIRPHMIKNKDIREKLDVEIKEFSVNLQRILDGYIADLQKMQSNISIVGE